jgi:hypothetical protein
MKTGFYLFKKHVPGASQLTHQKALIAAVNYIIFLEQTIQKMKVENSKAPLPSSNSQMDCTWPFSPVDLTVNSSMDSSDSLSPVHEDSITQELPLASTPIDDSLESAVGDLMDQTLENLVPVISLEEELPELNSFEDLTGWL